MLYKVKKFLKLSMQEKKLFFESYVLLGVIRTTMIHTSFSHMSRTLEQHKEIKRLVPLHDKEKKVAELIGESIMRASAYTPWESTCLTQVLVAQKMLQKRGIAGAFYLGAMKSEKEGDMMRVHAWSKCGESIITGAGRHTLFRVFSIFTWQGKNDSF